VTRRRSSGRDRSRGAVSSPFTDTEGTKQNATGGALRSLACGQRLGGYQVRVAVLHDRSKAVGTAAQFVDVPAVGDGRLAGPASASSRPVGRQRR